MKKIFYFFCFAATGSGISGSDRIFIELARRWSKKFPIELFLFRDGKKMCERQNLDSENITYKVYSLGIVRNIFVLQYFWRIIQAIFTASTLQLQKDINYFIYSSSDFWMDVLPGYILKIRYSRVMWVASWYQTAPHPLIGFSEGKRNSRYKLHAWLYYLVQAPMKPLITSKADFVIVNNTDEIKNFPEHNKKKKVIVLIGAVDLELIGEFKKRFGKSEKKYDAVFQGRFHPQKGVVELIEIWKMVSEKKKDAKLVMIGDGPLMSAVKIRIKELKLENNIILAGYQFDGEEKYKFFSQSSVVLHPAFYDSGGMAAAEAMAFGLPCVGFDLKSYESYYPKGMIKIPIGDLKKYASTVIELTDNTNKREKIGQEAEEAIWQHYSWDKRANEVLGNIS